MNWFKFSNKSSDLSNRIKDILRKNILVEFMFNSFGVPIGSLDNDLIFEIKDLKGKFSEADGKTIVLDSKLVNDDFFYKNFHFVIHELNHWLKRKSEDMWYFNDREEIQSFVLAIAWELISGKQLDRIKQKLYPIVSSHFKDKREAEYVFNKMVQRAEILIKYIHRK